MTDSKEQVSSLKSTKDEMVDKEYEFVASLKSEDNKVDDILDQKSFEVNQYFDDRDTKATLIYMYSSSYSYIGARISGNFFL